MQKFIAIGRIGQDPTVRNFEGGGKLATTSMAIDESYKNKEGEKVEKTEWLNLVFNGRSADFAEKWVTKGMKLFIEGKLRTRSWTTKEGDTRYTTEVVVLNTEFCESRSSQAAAPETAAAKRTEQPAQNYAAASGGGDDPSDDLPF